MKRIILTAFKDDNTGELGLGIEGMPRDETTNASTNGLLVAHDLIEHVNGPREIGTIDDELEALGAIWYVRGQHGELTRDGSGGMYTLHQNIASDVTRMFRDFFYGSYVSLSHPRTMPTDADDDFREIIEHALHDAPGELDQEERSAADTSQRLKDYLAVCLPRMRTGYRKARRRYERHGRYFANSLFWSIADAVDPHAKRPDYEGAQFVLVYGLRDGEAFARCEEYYGEDY